MSKISDNPLCNQMLFRDLNGDIVQSWLPNLKNADLTSYGFPDVKGQGQALRDRFTGVAISTTLMDIAGIPSKSDLEYAIQGRIEQKRRECLSAIDNPLSEICGEIEDYESDFQEQIQNIKDTTNINQHIQDMNIEQIDDLTDDQLDTIASDLGIATKCSDLI
tara:strand:+ start:1869 stop:2357 length:489 start_codon:yes stop_codon:yes gene_type:complete